MVRPLFERRSRVRKAVVYVSLLAAALATSGGHVAGQTGSHLGPLMDGNPYAGGDGSTMESAIVIMGMRTEAAVAWAVDRWIATRRPGWGVMDRTVVTEGCKTFDRISLLGPHGAPATVFFDRGGCYWRLDPIPE
jgi:hypothetical protein